MKQLVILSGKGGTGKTCLAAAFAHLAHDDLPALRAVLADADVDAANLELVLQPRRLETHDFLGGSLAVIDPALCQGCGICRQVCRFDAVLAPSSAEIDASQNGQYSVDSVDCEGCAACVYQCPEQAIRMQPQVNGQWYRSESRYGPLFHADLRPAQENSGKLVTLVKQQARLVALDEDYPLMIVDGPPGIGCPVISAISGADLALIVTEPTAAGIHDLQRIIETVLHFRVPALVCINKDDIYPVGAEQIRAFCLKRGLVLAGRIPFDETVTQAMINGEPVTAYRPGSPASRKMDDLWRNVLEALAIEPISDDSQEIS